MSALTVTSLHVYPIKSCRGIDLKSVGFDALGPLFDRRLMVVDGATSRFLTQREEPRLTMVTPRIGPTALQLSAPDMPLLKVSLGGDRGDDRVQQREITVWKFTGPADDLGDHAGSWFSNVLQRDVRLVRFAPDVIREVNPAYAGPGVFTSFTDGYPVLLTTQGSLDDLNGRMKEKVPMSRFRPNIVIGGGEPYAEDRWKRLRVGDCELDVVKPCARCAITTVDPLTAKGGKEPLATLATYRTRDGEVFFGQNCIHRSLRTIRVGDPVEVLEEG